MDEAYRGHDCALGNSGGFLFFEAAAPGQEQPRRVELAWIAFRHKAAVEAWCKSLALAELAQTKKLTDAESYQDHVSAYYRDVAAGKYSWGTKTHKRDECGTILWQRLDTEEGRDYLGFLLARDRDPAMTLPLFQALTEDNPDGFALCLNEVFRHPNSDTPLGKLAAAAMKAGATLEEALKQAEAQRKDSSKT